MPFKHTYRIDNITEEKSKYYNIQGTLLLKIRQALDQTLFFVEESPKKCYLIILKSLLSET